MKDHNIHIAVRFMTFKGFKARWRAFVGMGSTIRNKLTGKGLIFGKMLGSGAGKGFSIVPDFGTYAWFVVFDSKTNSSQFFKDDIVYNELRNYSSSIYGWNAAPIRAHGTWNGIKFFEGVASKDHEGEVAVLTRASIRRSQAIRFWMNVPSASRNLSDHAGLNFSKGVGEIPLFEQATLSLWNSQKELNDFAYKSRQHAPVVKKTRDYNWYSEELFLRMRIIDKFGKNLSKK